MKHFIIVCIKLYQLCYPVLDQITVSVFGFSSACTQSPTCSNYTIHQIRKHGTIAGIRKGAHRISRCYSLPTV